MSSHFKRKTHFLDRFMYLFYLFIYLFVILMRPNFLGVELLKEFKEEYMKFEKERQELANAEKLFGIPITSYPVLMSMEQELKGLEQIFSIYERQQVTVWDWQFSLAFVCCPRVKLFRIFFNSVYWTQTSLTPPS
jgi:hypothetical protein